MNQIPQADVKEVLCRIRGVQNVAQIVPYIAGYTDSMTYDVDVYSSEGWMRSWDGVVPVGQRWPRPFLVRPPDTTPDAPGEINYEAWARGILYNEDLFLFVNEIPDWAPCQTDGTPTDTVPGGPTDDLPPGGPGRPIFPRGIGMLSMLLMNASPAELKALDTALAAVRGNA